MKLQQSISQYDFLLLLKISKQIKAPLIVVSPDQKVIRF